MADSNAENHKITNSLQASNSTIEDLQGQLSSKSEENNKLLTSLENTNQQLNSTTEQLTSVQQAYNNYKETILTKVQFISSPLLPLFIYCILIYFLLTTNLQLHSVIDFARDSATPNL